MKPTPSAVAPDANNISSRFPQIPRRMPRGLTQSEGSDPRNFTLEQWQQAKRQDKAPRTIKTAFNMRGLSRTTRLHSPRRLKSAATGWPEGTDADLSPSTRRVKPTLYPNGSASRPPQRAAHSGRPPTQRTAGPQRQDRSPTLGRISHPPVAFPIRDELAAEFSRTRAEINESEDAIQLFRGNRIRKKHGPSRR